MALLRVRIGVNDLHEDQGNVKKMWVRARAVLHDLDVQQKRDA